MQDVSTVVSDAMREIARSIAGLIDFKKLFGAAAKDIKFDASPFNALVDAAKKAYDKIRGLADSEYDAQERRITRAQEDEDRKYKHKYDLEVKSIRNSSMNEKQKQAAIEALDIKYETARIARERKREDEKYAREEAQKVKLLKLEWDHQAELDKIKKAEDTARQKLADDEEKRQNSLWFKVKGIFATTCEELATMWLTKFVMQTIGDTVVDLFAGFFKKAAKKGGEIMGEVATEAVSNAGDIVKGASGAISGLWTGLGAAVGSFLGTWLAGLGGPSGHQQQQQINDTKDSRNFLADLNNFMLGTVKPWFATTDKALGGYFEKFDGLKGSVDLTRSTMHSDLGAINKSVDGVAKAIGKIAGAQKGAILTEPQLVMTHGTPSTPEYIIPAPDLRSMMMSTKPGPRGDKKRRDILIQTTVNLNGIMVTPREFVRGQLLREIESAVKSGIRKSELQAALGV